MKAEVSKGLPDSMRSLSQHFNPYLSDFKSIAVFAFRKRSEAILGYCQKFFFEACNISHRSVIFYISLGGDSLVQIHYERQKMCLPFPQTGLE